jgi:hypothetical protein
MVERKLDRPLEHIGDFGEARYAERHCARVCRVSDLGERVSSSSTG